MDYSSPSSSVHGVFQAGKKTGVGSHFLLQGSFLTQDRAASLRIPYCRQILYHLSQQGSPKIYYKAIIKSVPGVLEGKESACNAGDLGLIPGLGRSPGEGNGNPLQYSCLENPMDKELGGLQSMESQRIGHN